MTFCEILQQTRRISKCAKRNLCTQNNNLFYFIFFRNVILKLHFLKKKKIACILFCLFTKHLDITEMNWGKLLGLFYVWRRKGWRKAEQMMCLLTCRARLCRVCLSPPAVFIQSAPLVLTRASHTHILQHCCDTQMQNESTHANTRIKSS